MRISIALTLASAVFAGSAAGSVLYANYNPAVATSFPTVVESFASPGGTALTGAEFTPAQSGTVDSLIAAVGVLSLGGTGTMEFKLFAGVSNPLSPVNPFSSTPLDTLTATFTAPADVIQNETFLSTLHPFLTPGQNYWLFLTPSSLSGASEWGVPSPGVSGVLEAASNSIAGLALNVSSQNLPAFEISGQAPVPEPNFKVVLGLVMIFLAGWQISVSRERARRRDLNSPAR
jgi:hypothetical protein